MPADADALAFLPAGDARAYFVDHPGDFVSWHAWILNAREESVFCDDVAVTDAASLHANTHVSRAGVGNFALDDFEVRSWFRYLYYFHFGHRNSPFFILDLWTELGCSCLEK